jgi:nucleoside-diphosphate-sugar epimerase
MRRPRDVSCARRGIGILANEDAKPNPIHLCDLPRGCVAKPPLCNPWSKPFVNLGSNHKQARLPSARRWHFWWATEPALFDQLGLAGHVHHEVGDVRDAQGVRKSIETCRPEFVFHVAAQPLVRLSYGVPVETFATNVIGTVHVFDALRSETLKPFNCSTVQPPAPSRIAAVPVTTGKCYENKEWRNSHREDDAMGGCDPYSASKGAAEIAIHAMAVPISGPVSARCAAQQPYVR